MMTDIQLHISGLVLRLDLSGTEPRLRKEMVEIFSHFLTREDVESHEVLRVVPVRTRRWKSVADEHLSFVREALREPLRKFPFTADMDRDIRRLQKRLRPFVVSRETRAFLEGAGVHRDIQIYQLPRGWLVRRHSSRESVLFLKARSRRRLKAASIYGATYFVASSAIPFQDGIMLHGVGISRAHLGLLFLGASGGGKTTVAELSYPGRVISDDCIIIKRDTTGYWLEPSPFDHYPVSDSGQRVALNMGLFLHKDERVYLEGIPPSEACSRILMNFIHHFRYYSADATERTFNLITDMCRQTPFFILHFDRSPSFWELLEDRLYVLNSKFREKDYGLQGQEKTTLRTSQGL
ncbi:MAG: hypothetical protein JRH06_05090 [Deltaproteobacteria bacterium]|nr:hypothetical protein [Deltaproteobacteria bacterium]MBW2136911.1 hypothetical protein [Deltaproteobacteria bacterium]